MTIYTVHVPAEARPGSTLGLERAELVKDGFHWLALFFPLLWLAFNRCWRAFLLVLLAVFVLGFVGRASGLTSWSIALLEALVALFVGVHAAALKSAALERRDMRAVDLVAGDSRDEAERRFFERWLALTAPAAATPASGAPSAISPSFAPPPPVVGLFPGGATA
jgi:hypothetical protein